MEIDASKPENVEVPGTYKGTCIIFYETGYEGPPWAFMDERFMGIPEEGFPKGKWSQDGLHIVESGDQLTIYSPDNLEEVVWTGEVSLVGVESLNMDQQTWKRFFIEEYPSTLTPANHVSARD